MQYVTEKTFLIHGAMMAACFTVLFPLGAILLHVLNIKNIAWFHGVWQTVTYLLAFSAFGVGLWIATTLDLLVSYNGHAIIGIIVICSLFFQPIFGIIHHRRYVSTGQSKPLGPAHRWFGRVMLVLGVINGGLGLQLAGEGNMFIIPYSVLAAVLYTTWFVVVVVKGRAGKHTDAVQHAD